jgi:outer membrane protein
MTLLKIITARTLAAALVLSVLVPSYGTAAASAATVHARATATPIPLATAPIPLPSAANAMPVAVPSPEASEAPIPYPAFGSPAPDVMEQRTKPNVPTTVTLAQAIDIAVIGSPTFATERDQYNLIRAELTAAQLALFPSISGTGSVERTYGGINSENTGSGSGSSTPAPGSSRLPLNGTSMGGQINVSQLIFDGGRVIAALREAQQGNLAGRDTLIRNLQTLGDSVATNYYAVLEDQASVRADAATAAEFLEEENSVRGQIKAGAAAQSALAAAQFQTAQARGTLITAQGALIAAQSTFATSLGLDADTAIMPAPLSNTPGPKVSTYVESLDVAMQTRPDYLAAQYTLNAAHNGVRYAELARIPSITANASDGYSEDLPQTHFVPGATLGATLSVPIFDQGTTFYNIQAAKATYSEDNAALLQSKLQVESDVRAALSGLISAKAALVQTQAELSSGKINLAAMQATYKVGAATITDVVTAEATYATAERDYIAALYGERLAEYTYTYAMGTSDLKL